MSDIIKGVVYNHGPKQLNGETKYKSVVAMVILSDKPLTSDSGVENYAVMGTAENISLDISSMKKYNFPFKCGEIISTLRDIAYKNPDDLDEIS